MVRGASSYSFHREEAVSYALFKDGKQISKAHTAIAAAEIEAFEKGVVLCMHGSVELVPGYEIRSVSVNVPSNG